MIFEMKQKIFVASLMVILILSAISTPVNVLATEKKDDDNKDNDDHKTHNSCNNIPKETPFRDLWIYVCDLKTQIDVINIKLNNLNTGGGGSTNTWCPPKGVTIDLSNSDFRLHNFAGCNLSSDTFTNADLRYASFTGANLYHADLSGTMLDYADFSGANLTGTNFHFALMNGVITTGCHANALNPPTGPVNSGTLPACGP